MGRSPCCDKVGLKKGPWTPEEDQKLLAYIQKHGHGSWRALPPKAGLQRCGKSCRLRWTNYLRPDIKRGKFSLQEEQTIMQLHALLGNRWSAIASHLPKRTDNEIKNYWNTHLKKRLVKMGIDPTTHKPKNHALGYTNPTKDIANLSHMAQWESARLEAEARIVRESSSSKLINNINSNFNYNAPPPPPPPPQPRPPCLDILKVWQGQWARSSTTTRKDAFATALFGHNANLLESPTSILNFSDNTTIINNNSTSTALGSINNNYAAVGVVGINPAGKSNLSLYGDEEGKGIMENSPSSMQMQMQLHDDGHNLSSINNYVTGDSSISSSLTRFPSFMDAFVAADHDLPPATATATATATDHDDPNDAALLFEDNKINYWTNILNVVNSPMGSPVF